MTRTRSLEEENISNLRRNIGRTTILLVGVSNYLNLEYLRGPSMDLEMMGQLLFEEDEYSCYQQQQIIKMEDPTSNDFRRGILEYVKARTAVGDILILYYSGHGCILNDQKFGFCFTDTELGRENNCVLPLSVVGVDEVIQTLSNYDTHPLFILDACFSNSTAPNGFNGIANSIDATIRNRYTETFGLIASCNDVALSKDTPDGGVFTQGFYKVLTKGLEKRDEKRFPYIDLNNIPHPLLDHFTHEGVPLPHIHIGKNMPNIPLVKNIAHRPLTIRFSNYLKQVIEVMWNEGAPKSLQLDQILGIGTGAYANHSKLSLPPWDLVEDGNLKRSRQLTEKGKQFATKSIKIPREIIKDPNDWEWKAKKGTDQIFISDI